MLRCLRCLIIPLFIVFAPLALFILYWWLRTPREPEPTLMGAPSARPSSAIEIPPAALAAQQRAAAVGGPSFAAAPAAPTRAITLTAPAPEAAPTIPAPEGAVEIPAAPVAPAPPDDLRRLEGIGPKVAGLLEAADIVTFAQLAETEVAHLRDILDAANLRFLDPTTWPEQAALAAQGDWEAFEKLAGELKGGRRIS